MLKFISLNHKQLNNKGMTLTELVISFALLALFMVAATRMITYTVNIYYSAKGTSTGLEVSNMIAERVVGQLEGASNKQTVSEVENVEDATPSSDPVVSATGDSVRFCDSTGSVVTIQKDAEGYIVIHYDEVTTGTILYDAVDWKFDSKAYMGYRINQLAFENPGSDYPENVMKMTISLVSPKYGEYTSHYFIKCANIKDIRGI